MIEKVVLAKEEHVDSAMELVTCCDGEMRIVHCSYGGCYDDATMVAFTTYVIGNFR